MTQMARRITERKKSAIIRLYTEKGLTPVQIAERLEVSAFGVRYTLTQAGVPLRSRSEAKTRGDLPGVEVLRKHYEEDQMSCYAIGKKYGMSPATVYLRLQRAGVPLRDITEAVELRDQGKKSEDHGDIPG